VDERQANAVAEALGGSAWNSGGGIWLVRFERTDGKLVVISAEMVCEYRSVEVFDRGKELATAAVALHWARTGLPVVRPDG
jgi:hypothetical protein